MDILENFGVDVRLLIAQVVNFLIVLFILRRFLYRPILSTLQKRRESIKQGLEASEEARLRLEKVIEKEKQILNSSNKSAQKMIGDAKKEATEMIQKAQVEAKIQAERLVSEAKLQIALEAKETEKRLANNISRLAIELIQRSALELFGKREQEIVMKNVLSKFKKKTN